MGIIPRNFASLFFSGALRPGFPLGGPSAPDKPALWSNGTDKNSCMGDGGHSAQRIARHRSATEVSATRYLDNNYHAGLAKAYQSGRSRAIQDGPAQGGITGINRPLFGH